MTMNNEDRKALVDYRLEKADIEEYTPQVTALVGKLKSLVD